MGKVAIIHDWLTGLRGGERVLLEFLNIYPQADIFTLVHVPSTTDPAIDTRVKQQSWIGKLPFAGKIYRHFLPLYPQAIRSLDLNGYSLIISLSHAAAKNITVPKGAKHLCYCFTPMRYIWDQADTYFGKYKNTLEPLLKYLQHWDRQGSKSVDKFAVISKFVAARVRHFYNRSSEVIYPPINTDWIRPISKWKKGDAFLYAGALVPYKRPDVVVRAFNKLNHQLIVAGSGPMLKSLKDQAGKNIIFVENASDEQFSELYRTSRALVFPAVEDFGMIPVECMAAGRPVIGVNRGGLKESLIGVSMTDKNTDIKNVSGEKATGILIPARLKDKTKDKLEVLEQDLINGIKLFEKIEDQILPENCIAQAKKFSPQIFQDSWRSFAKEFS